MNRNLAHEEEKPRTSVFHEEEMPEALEEEAGELAVETGRRWFRGGVTGLALSDYGTCKGRLL